MVKLGVLRSDSLTHLAQRSAELVCTSAIVKVVVSFTGVDVPVAQVALEDAEWITDRAINALLDNLAA